MKFEAALAEYMRQTGAATARKLGTRPPTKDVAGATTWLRDYLRERVRVSDRLVAVVVALLAILFLTGIGLAIYHRDKPEFMSAIIGGDLLSLLAVVAWMRRIIVEKTQIDLSIAMIEALPPEQSAVFLMTLYERLLGRRDGTAAKLLETRTDGGVGK
jgi:hypothetical protein